jgi:hypothetical protein
VSLKFGARSRLLCVHSQFHFLVSSIRSCHCPVCLIPPSSSLLSLHYLRLLCWHEWHVLLLQMVCYKFPSVLILPGGFLCYMASCDIPTSTIDLRPSACSFRPWCVILPIVYICHFKYCFSCRLAAAGTKWNSVFGAGPSGHFAFAALGLVFVQSALDRQWSKPAGADTIF